MGMHQPEKTGKMFVVCAPDAWSKNGRLRGCVERHLFRARIWSLDMVDVTQSIFLHNICHRRLSAKDFPKSVSDLATFQEKIHWPVGTARENDNPLWRPCQVAIFWHKTLKRPCQVVKKRRAGTHDDHVLIIFQAYCAPPKRLVLPSRTVTTPEHPIAASLRHPPAPMSRIISSSNHLRKLYHVALHLSGIRKKCFPVAQSECRNSSP